MTPQDVLLLAYALTQLASQVIEFLNASKGMTDEEFAAAWEAEKTRFASALDLWTLAGKGKA